MYLSFLLLVPGILVFILRLGDVLVMKAADVIRLQLQLLARQQVLASLEPMRAEFKGIQL